MTEGNPRLTAKMDAAWKTSDLAGMERAMNEYASEGEVVVSLRVQNSHKHPMTFILEPWAEALIMAPGSSVFVFACGPQVSEPLDKLHVECGDEQITVWAWFGCIAYAVAVE